MDRLSKSSKDKPASKKKDVHHRRLTELSSSAPKERFENLSERKDEAETSHSKNTNDIQWELQPVVVSPQSQSPKAEKRVDELKEHQEPSLLQKSTSDNWLLQKMTQKMRRMDSSLTPLKEPQEPSPIQKSASDNWLLQKMTKHKLIHHWLKLILAFQKASSHSQSEKAEKLVDDVNSKPKEHQEPSPLEKTEYDIPQWQIELKDERHDRYLPKEKQDLVSSTNSKLAALRENLQTYNFSSEVRDLVIKWTNEITQNTLESLDQFPNSYLSFREGLDEATKKKERSQNTKNK